MLTHFLIAKCSEIVVKFYFIYFYSNRVKQSIGMDIIYHNIFYNCSTVYFLLVVNPCAPICFMDQSNLPTYARNKNKVYYSFMG